jgi:cytoskeleton protein RodZ
MVGLRKSRIATAIRSQRENRLPSFGEKLRREREKRSITLDQISQSTKIGTRMLQALEEDKFNQLPGGIFNKGFVRAYARHLGLDEDQAVADYLEASGEAPPVQPELPAEEPVHRIEASAATRQRQLPWGIFAAILLLVALALSIWSHRQKKHESTATPAPSGAQQSSDDHAVHTATAPQPAASSPSDQSPVSSSVSATVSSAAPVTPAKAPATTAVVMKTPSETPVLLAPGEFVVVVQARVDSWTAIQSDGRTVYSGILVAGDQRSVRGRKEVVVKAGNAGGIDLRFNGKKLGPQGEIGQVRTITFGPGGAVPGPPPSPPAQ